MMNTCAKGVLGETKTMTRLTELGWDVFIPLSGHSPFDLIAVSPEGDLFRVSVKTCFRVTKYGSYDVQIKQSQPMSNGYKTKGFDIESCDILACYIGPEDKVCFVNTSSVKSKMAITFRKEVSKHSNNGSRLIENCLIPNMPTLS